jgi:hypothetical protein
MVLYILLNGLNMKCTPQAHVLNACFQLLAPFGKLRKLYEVEPKWRKQVMEEYL